MNNFSDWFMPLAIAVIMFGIGLNLCFADFKSIIYRPRAVVSGLILQMLLLPLTAFGIISFWDVDPLYKMGFILIAACPGGTMSNLVTYLLRGHLALSVALTAFNSFLILFSIPLIINIAANLYMGEFQAINLSFGDTLGEVLSSVIIPVILGIIVNEFTPKSLTERANKIFKYVAAAAMIGMVFIVIFGENSTKVSWLEQLDLLIPLVLLNISTIFIGFYLGRALKLNHRSNFTISIELGLQNSALAIFIATKVMEKPEMAQVAVLYASFSFLLTFGMAYLLKIYFKPVSARERETSLKP